ncbi:prephenate dehydrogenase/arogenate dehydrogenase family protein [Pseudooceanicola sp. CBS1P-1]|uniref:Prephenate dehydrogenase/arogenate dehydrogenase family protein n=1 Tax=Pseudooceanicola albus TaxID=2692189 RepID=A0A6L7FZS4_9RHOB|nr:MULTISPECIES: prephenate dehydrogenase/arogenate dehydrogenase family protein [Pseudooceanicola]MBT9382783.1 prephenate dehydrogenase/arogenate dehydrogenase family protein [Pseudooceanicola endophyticus]MXN17321.1 prephenate dehydrogenase/arogenate dehydrogenase family protein [Pseudooceanicola albus]
MSVTSFPEISRAVALFGFGAFGELVARTLLPDMPVVVCDPDPAAQARARALGATVLPPEAAARAGIVVLAVPVPLLERVLRDLAPHLRPGQLVIETCSVKEEPARLLETLLPEGVEALATHPMFGPASAARGLRGCQMVLCPLRGNRWRRVAAFLRARHGLRLLRATPEEHDRQAALSQGLTHLLAHAMARLGPQPAIRTRSYELMMEAFAMVADDAPEVYTAITRGNAHVAPLSEALIAALRLESGARREPAPGLENMG